MPGSVRLSDLARHKEILRAHMREIRVEAAARDPDAAERLAARFPLRLFERYGPVVAGYHAIGTELDPRPLLDRLQAAGATIVLPRLESGGDLSFRRADDGPLEQGPLRVRQPSAAAREERPSLILAPLLAFDARGARLGYGKGCYDRALAALRRQGRAFYLGIAYAQQQADVVPAERHDVPLDWVETPLSSVPLFLGRAMAR